MNMNNNHIDEIKENQLAIENLEESARWFLGFLERNDHWVTNVPDSEETEECPKTPL